MKSPDFAYVRADTLDEAFRLKARHGADARWLAGGQSLLAALAFRLSEPTALIDISRIDVLQGIALNGSMVRIGAGTTHTALSGSDIIRRHVPLLAAAVPHISHTAIRNRGTIGGSLAFADPAAELPACCVVLEATFVAASAKGERRISARDFFHGVYATALENDELLTAIEFPQAMADDRHALIEITRRTGDYAMAGIAVALRLSDGKIDHARLAFFALGDKPVLANVAGGVLLGNDLDEDQIERATKAVSADIDPPGDLNGGPEMKRHLAQVVLKRALRQILSTGIKTPA